MTSPLPLYAHAFSPLFDALLARPSVLAFSIFLPTSFTTQLDKLRSPPHMNTLLPSCDTPRTRSLIVALPNTSAIRRPRQPIDAPFYYPDGNSDKPTWHVHSFGDCEGQTQAAPHRSASPSSPALRRTPAPSRDTAGMVCRLHTERALCDNSRTHRCTDRWYTLS